jgi:hypothetical protein
MKYFGKKSVSSWMSVALHIFWYATLVLGIVAAIGGIVILSSHTVRDFLTSEIAKDMATKGTKEIKDWEGFINLPLFVKGLLVPYIIAIVAILLQIIKKSQEVFTNFKNDIVFNKANVRLIATVAKFLIAFSIMTIDFSSLFTSIFLLLVCEIINRGTDLQEEHDLTV